MKHTIDLDSVPYIENEHVAYWLNGKVILSTEDTEVHLTEVVSADDITLPINKLPYLLIEKFELVLMAAAQRELSSPTYDWEDAPEL